MLLPKYRILIAQSVEECIQAYKYLLKEAFEPHPDFRDIVPPIGDYVYTINVEKFHTAFKKIEKDKTGNTDLELMFDAPEDGCSIFVVAENRVRLGYNRLSCPIEDIFPCYSTYSRPPSGNYRHVVYPHVPSRFWTSLSGVALETCRKQTIKLPSVTVTESKISIHRQKRRRFDVGDPLDIVTKQLKDPCNPAEVALREARMLWKACQKFCLLSVGIGQPAILRLLGEGDVKRKFR